MTNHSICKHLLRNTLRCSHIFRSHVFLCAMLGFHATLLGQEKPAALESSRALEAPGADVRAANDQAASRSPILLDDLPEPPPEIQRWFAANDIEMTFGNRSLSPSESPQGVPFRAETSYRMKHRYRSNPRWSIDRSGQTRTCTIQLRFRSIQLRTSHQIWFMQHPDTETFWTDPLVLHELDHLRLSADPRLAKRFAGLLRSEPELRISLEPTDRVDARWVQQQVDRYVQKQFAKISDLVLIRYQELDRLTQHGLRQIPENSEVAATLDELQGVWGG